MATPHELVEAFKDMTLIEIRDFVKEFETTFDVSATPTPTPPTNTPPPGEPEVPTEFDVLLTRVGEKKVTVIKVVRELNKELDLKAAKDLVEAAPVPVLKKVQRAMAEKALAQLLQAGAGVIMVPSSE